MNSEEPITIEQLLAEEAAKLGILSGETEEEDDFESSQSLMESARPPQESDVLDDLLSESMYAYQAAIKAKKGQRLSGAEKDVLHYQDVEKNWLPIGLVGLVSKENCRCGSSHSVFVGWYGILQHRNDISAKRICRITSAVDPINYLNAPSASYTMEKSVSVCGNCLSMDEASPDQILQWGLITLK